MGPGGSGQLEDNPCSSASVSLEPHIAKSSFELPEVFLTISSCQLRGSNEPGTLGDAAIQVRKLICKWEIQQVLFKAPLPLSYPWAIFPCLKPFGRCCIGKNSFLCALRKSSSFFYRQLGFRVCLLTIYGIPQWIYPGSPPTLKTNNIWRFPKPRTEQMRERFCF